jgi:hypothetical protein
MAQTARREAALPTADSTCIRLSIEFFFTKLPSLIEASHVHDENRESAARGLAKLCSDQTSAKQVINDLLDMVSGLQAANSFGENFNQRSKHASETSRYVLEAIKRCLVEIQKNFPSTTEKPSDFMSDEELVTKIFRHLDQHYMMPVVEGSHDGDRLQPLAGSAMQLLTVMNLTVGRQYLDSILKNHSSRFHSLVIIGYFKVDTKQLPDFLQRLNASPAISNNRSCKALCKGLHQLILDWCKSNPNDFFELWQRGSDRLDLIEIRETSLQLFCAIGSHVNKDKRRCAMWPCMGALLRLCSTRIKSSLENSSMKKGLFSGLSDDDSSKFSRRFEKLVNELSLSAHSSPEQKSHFLVSLQVIRDALDAITILRLHPQSPHTFDSQSSLFFFQELEQLWRLIGSSDIAGVKKPNMHICCDLLLDPTKMWQSDFSVKGEVAFPVGVLGHERDSKSRIAKLAYDILLSACQIKSTPNAHTTLQTHNPFNIKKFWELLVAQKVQNVYLTLFFVRVIREIIQSSSSKISNSQDHSPVLETFSLLRSESASERTVPEGHGAANQMSAVKSRFFSSPKSTPILPGSEIISLAASIMECTIQELSMTLIDVLRQSIQNHHDAVVPASPTSATAASDPKSGQRNVKSVIFYWAKQVLRIIIEAPHLGFIPVSSSDIDQIGWTPVHAKQVFRDKSDTQANSYKAILLSLETSPAKWAITKPYCVVFTILMCFESFDLMLKDPEREHDRKERSIESIEAITSMFSIRLMPLYYPEAPIKGALAVFGVVCAAASEQILTLIKERQPYFFAQNVLHVLRHSCHQLLQFMSQNEDFMSQLDDADLPFLKPRLSVESLSVEWLGHRVEFMIFIAACEVNADFLAELYAFIGVFCDVLSAFQSTDHPHFLLFQSLGAMGREMSPADSQSGISRKSVTHLIHNALRDATFQISRNSFSLKLGSYLFETWARYVRHLMATDKQQRTILSEDENRLESYASFLLLLSPELWAPEKTKENGKMSKVFTIFIEFFNKMLSEYVDDWAKSDKLDKKPDDKHIKFSRIYFKKFLSKSFPSMFCEELFSCMVKYSKDEGLPRLCKKYSLATSEDPNELLAKYCLPLYCDILLAVLGSLSDSLSQKSLNDLKELSLTVLCSWANNSSKALPDDFIQRLQRICQVVSAMTGVRSLLPFANGYGFWSLWLQQTYDWAVRLSNEQSLSSRVEIFNAINLLLQVVPENKLEEKDGHASDKKYLKFILNELEKQTTLTKASIATKTGSFINDDIQGPLMDGLAAVIKKSKFSVGLDPCLKFVTDLRLSSNLLRENVESDPIVLTKAVFSLKVLQQSLLPHKESHSGSSYSEAAALNLKFSQVINLMLDPPHFFIAHGASKVADASESETLSMILTKVALSRDHVSRSIGAVFCLVRNVASQIADLLVSLVSADIKSTLTSQTM